MLRTDRTRNLDIQMDSDMAFEASKSTRPSMIYQMLPAMVSNRIPTLPSLRKSLNDARNRSLHSKSSSVSEGSEPETPPPSYSSRPGSGSATPNRFSLAFAEGEIDFSDSVSERPCSSGSGLAPRLAVHEAATGINWRYASQGRSLITQAHRESSAPLQDMHGISASLTRQLYVHGITYLLRGLPTELTPEERLSLQAALPVALADTRTMADEHAMISVGQRTALSQSTPLQDLSILHRITATVVFQTFILVQFLLPYVRLFIASAYQFERRYQITNRVVNTGVMTVDEISRGGLRLSQMVCQMNDGKVGQIVHEMALWWIRGVTGGIQQGFEQLGAAGVGKEGASGRRSVREEEEG
ncbi:hypothetical protein T440DRAFT_466245 [Plenodomus tracheiphilus IPT5]|uniref:Uncharacterized protein n=1 Tax=Plenodomus tracheiphilus IPT5 TaxID=1408161 RepID=A0A6A7BFJ8_9PLEO|nr:hypothetical protein T440DRAFT_466245 [Plenodomus tracheiphilus IPT5]